MEKEIQKSKSLNKSGNKLLKIKTHKGWTLINEKDVICMEAESNYTNIFVRDMNATMTSKTLKYWEDILNSQNFIRCHRSHLINKNEIKSFNKNERSLELTCGRQVPLSRRFKIEKLNFLKLL